MELLVLFLCFVHIIIGIIIRNSIKIEKVVKDNNEFACEISIDNKYIVWLLFNDVLKYTIIFIFIALLLSVFFEYM